MCVVMCVVLLISATEFKRRKDSLVNQLWELIKEVQHPYCLDCGKRLTKEDAVLVIDRDGIVIYCFKDSWARINMKEFWKRTLKE